MTPESIVLATIRPGIKNAFSGSFFNICGLANAYDAIKGDRPAFYSGKVTAANTIQAFHCKSWSDIDDDSMIVLIYSIFILFDGNPDDWDEAFVRQSLVKPLTSYDHST